MDTLPVDLEHLTNVSVILQYKCVLKNPTQLLNQASSEVVSLAIDKVGIPERNHSLLFCLNMSSPQLENGYTSIAQELFEAIYSFDFPSASPLKILLLILRKTYGYHKKTDVISLSQITKATNLSRQTVNDSLQWLVKSCLLVKGQITKKGVVYGINKDFEQWVVCSSGLVKTRPFYLVKRGRHTKDILTKDNMATSSQTNQNPMNIEELNDGDITYEEETPLRQKKYGNKRKLYSRLCIYYMNLLGKTGNVVRFFPAMKEIYELHIKDFPTDTEEQIEREIKGRIKVAHEHYTKLGFKEWGLGKIAENWDLILTWKV